MVIGGLIDLAGGGGNQAKSAADKLIQGVRQGTQAELQGIDAARAAQLQGAVASGLLGREGLANALTFLGGPSVAPMTPAQLGLPPGLVSQEFAGAVGTPFPVFGEGNMQTLGGEAFGTTGTDVAGGLLGAGGVPSAHVMRTGMVPRQAIDPTSGPTGLQGGLLGAVRDPFRPFVQAGQEAAGALTNPVAQFMNDPAVQFRLQQGQQAIERSAAARGGQLSGATLKDLTEFSQGLASQEYNNAFNRALATAGLGLGAAGTQAGLTSDIGQRIAQGLIGVGAQEGGIADQVGNILAGSSLGAAQSIAQRERLLGEIKAGKKASELSIGQRIDEAFNPLVGAGLGAAAAFGLPNVSGLFAPNTFTGRPLTPAEQLLASYGVNE